MISARAANFDLPGYQVPHTPLHICRILSRVGTDTPKQFSKDARTARNAEMVHQVVSPARAWDIPSNHRRDTRFLMHEMCPGKRLVGAFETDPVRLLPGCVI